MIVSGGMIHLSERGRRSPEGKDEQMTLMSNGQHIASGRNYIDPYRQDRGERLNILCAVVALTILALVLLVWQFLPPALGVPKFIIPTVTDMISELGRMYRREDLVANTLSTAWYTLLGFAIGSALGAAIGYLLGLSEFWERVLSPYILALQIAPKVAFAPLFIMWFGYNATPKLLVTVLIVFFPVLVNTVAGLAQTTAMQRDLMRTYAAGYWQSFFKLRLPAAMPFIFNGLKISTTLALVGAIVAEFFGSPTLGMGFRISTSVGQLSLDMVWAEIVVAALAGTVFYGAVATVEKAVTFWHPSQRG